MFCSDNRNGCGRPIITLGFPRSKMYVVTSPSLVAACDRRPRIVSFAPYLVQFAKRILLASQPTVDLLSENLLEERGAISLRPETMKAIHESVAPGNNLDKMTSDFLKEFVKFLDSDVGVHNEDGVSLFSWIRRWFTMASTDAIYGLMNPMRESEVFDAFWYVNPASSIIAFITSQLIQMPRAVDKDFAYLGLMVFTEYVAPKGSKGRRVFFDAFEKYYAGGGLHTASRLIKARYEVNRKHGVSCRDIAQFELAICTAVLVNTIPSIFWTIWHVFSDPILLAQLRCGIEAEVLEQTEGYTEASTTPVNVSNVIEAVPLLESVVKEVLRVQSNTALARYLLKDTIIKDDGGATYLLREGSTLVMPAAPIHLSESVWGPTAQTFDPTRFLKLKEKGQRVVSSAWRAFGGGNALCPGRQFAMRELSIILIAFVLRYDLQPLDGTWNKPEMKHHISTSIPTPIQDIRVKISRRKDVRNIKWSFIWES